MNKIGIFAGWKEEQRVEMKMTCFKITNGLFFFSLLLLTPIDPFFDTLNFGLKGCLLLFQSYHDLR
jgi:hypothetical protein